jgi:hypothetical protein
MDVCEDVIALEAFRRNKTKENKKELENNVLRVEQEWNFTIKWVSSKMSGKKI